MYPGRTPQNQGPGGPPMVQYPGVYYKTPSSSPWPPMQTAPASAAPSSSYVQYPSKYTATSSAHSATRSALAESYERIRNEMRGLKSESQPSYQPAPPAPSLKQKNDPLTSLCNNTSVSLSSLLEAAMAPNAGSSNRTTEDPIMKKTILGKCERKIAQLYRDRITGMGSFFPLVEANTTTVADTNYLLRHCPRLEFNSEPIGAPWTCPDVKIELKKPDPPKPTVDLPQTIKTVESIKSLGATLPNTSIPPPGIEPVNVGLSEPSINLITDMTFEKWADVEREKRQHERERQWEQLMMFTGRGRSSQEKEERRRSKRSRRSRSESTGRSRSSSRRRSRSSRRSRSLSRRRSRSKSRRRRSSSSRSRARNRSRKRSRSRRHHSSSFSLSPSPSPRRRGESRRSPASPPPRRRRTPPRDCSRRRSSNDIPAQPVSQPAASWPGPYSSSQSQSGPYGPPVGVPPEYPNAPPGYPVHQPPPSPYIQPGMPLRPYGPRPGYPYPAPGLRPPGVGPWPGSLPGLPYQLPPPRGLCATPNMVPIGQPPAPGTGSFQYSSPEVIVIDDGDNAVPGSPMHPPGLSPEIPTKPDPSDCLRMQCFSHLSRIRKVHEYLYKLQRDCEGLKDIIYDMEADNREFHGVYALIRGFLCKMEINTSKNPGAAFKVVLPTSQTMSMMWAIHHAYHDIKKDELLTLFDDLFNDSPSLNVSSLVSTVFKQCARCVSDARQKYREAHDREETRSRPRDNARANRARERDSPHRHREDSDRSRRRSRDSSRKSRTPDKHSRERTVRSSSRKSGSPRKSSKEPTVRRRSRKSRSPRKHSNEKRARSTSRKSRSPRKRSEGRNDRDESKRSRSREKRSKEEGGQDASTKSTSSRKSSKEKSEEKSTERSTGESPEGKSAETSRPENGDADCSRPSKDSKSEEGIDKSPKSGVTDGVRAKIDEPPIAAVPKNVQNQPPKGTNTEKPRPDGEGTGAKTNADSRSNKAEDFKTRVRQVQSTVELLKKQIDDLEGPNRKTDEPMLLVKAGMLCRRLTINDKAEIKIVVTPEILPDMIRIVHTMAPVHAPAPKTVVVYKKHFTPMDDIDKVVTEVLDNCDTCKRK